MNYKEIVFLGIIESYSDESIAQYFQRIFKKAKEEHYSENEFFNGCLKAVESFKKEINNEVEQHKKKYKLYIENWEKSKIKRDPIRKQKAIKDLKKTLNNIDEESYKMNVSYSNKKGSINNIELNTTRNILEKIKQDLISKNKPKTTNIEPLNFELNQSEVIYLFDILQEAGFLNPPRFHNGSYYRKLELYFTADKKEIKDASQKRNKFKEIPLSTSQEIKKRLLKAINNIPY